MKSLSIFPYILLFFLCQCTNPTNKDSSHSEKSESIITLDRPGYQVQYPANCHIDSSDVDFDIDSYFTIESENGSQTIFFLFDQSLNPDTLVEAQIKAHLTETIKNGQVTRFDHWGQYTGKGAIITGKLSGVFKGELKIFSFNQDSITVQVVSCLYNEDMHKDSSAIRLIEKSFRLKH